MTSAGRFQAVTTVTTLFENSSVLCFFSIPILRNTLCFFLFSQTWQFAIVNRDWGPFYKSLSDSLDRVGIIIDTTAEGFVWSLLRSDNLIPSRRATEVYRMWTIWGSWTVELIYGVPDIQLCLFNLTSNRLKTLTSFVYYDFVKYFPVIKVTWDPYGMLQRSLTVFGHTLDTLDRAVL